jgi:protein arginine kinase activator
MHDRPLDCGDCKKPIKICYTEIANRQINYLSMCQDCPELQKKMGQVSKTDALQISDTGLCCGNCKTTLESIRQGALLGCSECYEVFKVVIAQELTQYIKISVLNQLEKGKKQPIWHLGRSPKESMRLSPALKLLALNNALKDTLKREDYEQAASIRDQIKEIMETNPDDGKK